jgi:hypothetical protein
MKRFTFWSGILFAVTGATAIAIVTSVLLLDGNIDGAFLLVIGSAVLVVGSTSIYTLWRDAR